MKYHEDFHFLSRRHHITNDILRLRALPVANLWPMFNSTSPRQTNYKSSEKGRASRTQYKTRKSLKKNLRKELKAL